MRWCCPFVCRSVDETRTRKRNFLKKTTLLWSLLTTNWTIPRWTFQRSDCWTHKIQDGGCPPYWKSFLAMNQQPIVRFQWNFVWGSCFSLNLGSSQKTGPARPGRGTKNCPSYHCSWLWSIFSLQYLYSDHYMTDSACSHFILCTK